MFKKYPACNLIKACVRVVRERLQVKAVTGTGSLATLAKQWWADLEMGSWQHDLYTNVLRDKASVVIVGWDGKLNRPTLAINELWDGHGGTCKLHFDSNEKLSYVSRRWNEHDEWDRPTNRVRLTVYFPDRIERFYLEQSGVRLMTIEECQAEDPDIDANPQPWVLPNGEPIGIAAVPIYNAPYEPEAAELMTVQVGVNESILSWHVSGRYGGFRVLVTENVKPARDDKGNELPVKWGPGMRIDVTSTGTSPSKAYFLPAEDMQKIFDGSVKPHLALACFIKRFPMHVFDVSATPTSGEMIRQMEAPLVAQVDDKKPMLADGWREVFAVAGRLASVYGQLALPEGRIDLEWKSSQSDAPLYDAQVLGEKAEKLGIPARQLWMEAGYTEAQIEQMLKWKQDEQASSVSASVQQALLAQQRGAPEEEPPEE